MNTVCDGKNVGPQAELGIATTNRTSRHRMNSLIVLLL
jgi:hypothetical protein